MQTIAVKHLASLRDLRSRILETGLAVRDKGGSVSLLLQSPRLQESTIRSIWDRAMDLFDPGIRERMSIDVVHERPASRGTRDLSAGRARDVSAGASTANYTYEVLRFLLNEALSREPIWFTPATVQDNVGASAPTVRRALRALQDAGVIEIAARGAVRPLREPPVPWVDLLARLGAAPPIFRFKYREGGRDMRALLHRAESRMHKFPNIAVSGAAAALLYQPSLDLVGFPRLDFIAHGSQAVANDFVDVLDAELQPEPNPLAPAAVVITLTHARKPRFPTLQGLRTGGMGDIVLALEDARLYDIAHLFGHEKHRWQ